LSLSWNLIEAFLYNIVPSVEGGGVLVVFRGWSSGGKLKYSTWKVKQTEKENNRELCITPWILEHHTQQKVA
jgi:hypothetical protein